MLSGHYLAYGLNWPRIGGIEAFVEGTVLGWILTAFADVVCIPVPSLERTGEGQGCVMSGRERCVALALGACQRSIPPYNLGDCGYWLVRQGRGGI